MASEFNGKKATLKYLFVATFEDGHIIYQTPDDVSTIEPEKRSAFFDVLAYEQKSPLIQFELIGDSNGDYALIDLRTGIFEVNGLEINIADQNFVTDQPLRLVYFRETRVENDVKMEKGKQDELIEQRFYINRYFIGWQTTVNGENVQRTIALAGK